MNVEKAIFMLEQNIWKDQICVRISNDCYDEIMDALKEPEWISVNDRLPKIDQEVLVYAIGKIDGFIGDYVIEKCKRYIQRIFPASQGEEIWSSPYQFFHTDYKITHWMPLPEPPKEGR